MNAITGAFAAKIPALSEAELIDRLLSFEGDVAALARRHGQHRDHVAAVGARLDRFLAESAQ